MKNRTITPDPAAWLRTINLMLKDGEFEFSREYLESVKDFIEENDRITPGQTKAILNIRRTTQ